MSVRITEAEMASAVRTILKRKPNRSATFADLREEVPKHVKLSRADRAKSPSRPGEELWEQIIRNLVSHKHEGFVSIKGGMRLQWQRGPKPHAVRGRKAHSAHTNGYAHTQHASA